VIKVEVKAPQSARNSEPRVIPKKVNRPEQKPIQERNKSKSIEKSGSRSNLGHPLHKEAKPSIIPTIPKGVKKSGGFEPKQPEGKSNKSIEVKQPSPPVLQQAEVKSAREPAKW
jgi:hypothetical protein